MSAAEPPLSPSQQPSQSRVEVEEVTTIVKSPLLRPTPAFLKVIHYGGGQGDTFTMGEILDYVKKYIDDKKLYDEHNPRIIYCKGNDLGAAFNVDQITIPEVLPVFVKHCTQEKDSRLTISRQVNTRPLCEDQSTSTSSPSSSSSQSTLSSHESVSSPSATPAPSPLPSSVLPSPTLPSPVLPSSDLPSSSPIVSSSTSRCNPSSHNEGRCITTCSTAPQTIPATGPSTTISNLDMERAGVENPMCPPSSSFNILAMDETDGNIPWSCQVEVGENDEEAGGHDSLVVEYSSDNFSVEYELVSSSEAESYHQRDTEESRSPSESTPATAFYLVCEESDIEYLADYSDTDSESDAELGEDDKWECNMCQFRNSALYRNCGKCWSIRPDWLPTCSSPQPTGAENKDLSDPKATGDATAMLLKSSIQIDGHTDACESEKSNKSAFIEEMSGCASPANFQISSQDSAIGSMACSQELTESKADDKPSISVADSKIENNNNSNSIRKRTYSSCLSDSQEEVLGKTKVGKILQGSMKKDEKEASPSDPCVICLTRPKTACIIHGKTGHQVCCYGCARMLKKKRKPCPICRRPIQRVVRNYF